MEQSVKDIWMSIVKTSSAFARPKLNKVGHLNIIISIKAYIYTYFNGSASTRCPMVTKLVSCIDINQAKDETLPNNGMVTQTYKLLVNHAYLNIL